MPITATVRCEKRSTAPRPYRRSMPAKRSFQTVETAGAGMAMAFMRVV
jgi:hypothetical protein